MVEILVAVAIVAVLAGLSVMGAQAFLERGKQVKEVSSAKQIVSAYLTAATERNGVLLEGYKPDAEVRFPNGNVKTGVAAARYPWRLAPYLDWEAEKIFMVNEAAELLENVSSDSSDYVYNISVAPALGINAYLVGGYYNGTQLFAPGDVHTRLGQAERARIVAFVSERSNEGQGDSQGELNGSWFVRPPRLGPFRWQEGEYDPEAASLNFGNVDFRYNKKAVCAFLDGSTRLMDLESLRDMRLWSAYADSPDYSVSLR